MKKSFKSFIIEMAASEYAEKIATSAIGGNAHAITTDDEEYDKLDDIMVSKAKQLSLKHIDTAAGVWTISTFMFGGKKFSHVIAPPELKRKPVFYVNTTK
jgi:hypothetical protein